MNVYDFDNTVYRGDSETRFFFYCVKRFPKVRKYLAVCAFFGTGYLLHLLDKKSFKQKFLSFVREIENLDAVVDDFWEKERFRIKDWYWDQKRADDVIISASPEFLLRRFCLSLGVERLMATRADEKTGRIEGANCHDTEKVNRYHDFYKDEQMEEFYSDSYSDTPLAKIAKKAFLVKGNRFLAWKRWKI